jgi:hypothetical protein
MIQLYKRGLKDYSRQVLAKNPDMQKLINRLIEGVSTYHQKLSNLNELKHFQLMKQNQDHLTSINTLSKKI